MKKSFQRMIRLGAFALAIYMLPSCVSMTSLQTARTMEKGEFGGGFGGGMVNAEINSGTETFDLKAPFMEASARYGITDKLDAGAKITLIGTSGLDVKYQFLGDKQSLLAGSVGTGFGYLSLSSGSGDNISKSVITDINVPVSFSIHPKEWFAFYASPRYTLRLNSYNNTVNGVDDKGSSNSNWYGITTGIRLGKKVGFLVEYSYYLNDTDGTPPLTQFAAGLAIGIR
jgi:hypothetical protein